MSASAPSVTVLIPCFNTAPYLPATLKSVLQQTSPASEIILVDDGSSDGTLDVIREFAARHSVIKVIALAGNQGVVAARNAGLALATGDFVAMLDGDDIWTPDALALRIALAQQYPSADLIATDFCWFNEVLPAEPVGRIGLGPRGRARFAHSFATGEAMILQHPFDAAASTHFVWTGATLIKRSALLAVGNFEAAFEGPEDTLLWLRLAQRGVFVFSPKITAFYRQRAGSLVHSQKGPKELHYLKVLDRIRIQPEFAAHRDMISQLKAECHHVSSLHYQHRGDFGSAVKHAAKAALLQPRNVAYWRDLASSGSKAVISRPAK